ALPVGGIRRRGDGMIVQAGNDAGENVGLEPFGVEQIILEQLARLVRFVEGLQRQKAVRLLRELPERMLQSFRQVHHIAARYDGVLVRFRVGVGMGTGGPGTERNGGKAASSQQSQAALADELSACCCSLTHDDSPWLDGVRSEERRVGK